MSTITQRIKRLLPYFTAGRRGFAVAFGGSLVSALTEPVVPALLQQLLDKGFHGGGLPLWAIPVAIIGLFLIRGVAGFVATYALSWTSGRGVLALRRAMFGRLMDAQPQLFTKATASGLTNTLVYEVQSGAKDLVNSLLGLVKDSLTLIALLGYLLWLNWQLTLFVAFLVPSIGYVMRVVTRRLRRITRESQLATDRLAYVVEENVLAWRIVRLHDAAPEQQRRFEVDSERLRRLQLKGVVAAATMTPLTQMLSAIALSAVIVVALWQAGQTGATVGSFTAFVTAMLMLIAPIKHLSDTAGPLTRGLAALERAMAMIDNNAAEPGGTHDPGRSQGRIRLQGVSLRYRDDQPPALAGVDLDVGAGESVALVGPSGAGKSTLVNLLPRFLSPTEGEVLLDGVPLAQWDVRALRRQFALVSQDVVLFNDSVAANVALGDPDGGAGTEAQRERVRAALAAANLLDFVEGLPQGIDTPVGHNGSQFSGGQRQRLAIARAIYKNAPVLILDEATSALDSESERLVQAALERLMKGRTSIVIAHRLSTIERADRIVALDGGRIVEQGSHKDLLAHGGLYQRLHTLQFGGGA